MDGEPQRRTPCQPCCRLPSERRKKQRGPSLSGELRPLKLASPSEHGAGMSCLQAGGQRAGQPAAERAEGKPPCQACENSGMPGAGVAEQAVAGRRQGRWGRPHGRAAMRLRRWLPRASPATTRSSRCAPLALQAQEAKQSSACTAPVTLAAAGLCSCMVMQALSLVLHGGGVCTKGSRAAARLIWCPAHCRREATGGFRAQGEQDAWVLPMAVARVCGTESGE
jgi:hypothetical protein